MGDEAVDGVLVGEARRSADATEGAEDPADGLARLAGDDQGTEPPEQQQRQVQHQLAGGGSQVGVLWTAQVEHERHGQQQRR
jgi:hypothetical protein